MQLARQHSNDIQSKASAHKLAMASSNVDWLEWVLIATTALAALMAFSLLLPPGLAQVAQGLIGWSMTIAVLSIALLAVFKSLETRLEF